jgi:BlaI family transcriptional regulator, penicillinase repressor
MQRTRRFFLHPRVQRIEQPVRFADAQGRGHVQRPVDAGEEGFDRVVEVVEAVGLGCVRVGHADIIAEIGAVRAVQDQKKCIGDPLLAEPLLRLATMPKGGVDTKDYRCNLSSITDVNDMQISEAESVVMEVLWQRSPQTSEEVLAALGERQQWQEATVKTLLNRLLNKGAIEAQKDGRRYLYSPRLRREDWVMGESESMLARLFDGRVAPLVAHFSQHRKLSAADVAELRRLVDSLDEETGHDRDP